MKDINRKHYFYAMFAGFGAISLSIILFFMFYRLNGIGEVLDSLVQILTPFLYGSVVAYLLRPMCNSFEELFNRWLPEKHRKRADFFAIVMSFICLVLIVYTLIAMIVPRVYDSLLTLGNAIPSRLNNFVAWAESQFGEDERLRTLLDYFNTSYETIYGELETWVKGTLVPQLTTLVSGLGSSVYKMFRTVYNILIGLIVAIYLLSSRKRFAAQGKLLVHSILPDKAAMVTLQEITFIDRMFGGFIDAKILDSGIVGILCYLGCLILRIPNALLISVFVGITNIIPFFGPLIGAVPSTLLILIENPIKSVWFVVFVLVLQQLDGNIIGPRIMGNKIGISGFWVMFAIIFFGGTWGLFGMIVGVPLFAVIYDLLKKFVKKGLNKHDKFQLWSDYIDTYPEEQIPESKEQTKRTMADWTSEDWKTELLQTGRSVLDDLQKLRKLLLYVWQIVRKYLSRMVIFISQSWSSLQSRLRSRSKRHKR